MTRNQLTQRQRTAKNPLLIGSFDQTSLRVLTGTLGALNQVVGYRDTSQNSNGGHGGGTLNHWFQINLLTPAWIITRKGGPRPNYIEVSAYDLNHNPIEGRMIFQADSISTPSGNVPFYPYLGDVMGANSNLYNTFNPIRLDKGNDLYFPLEAGSYLICVSSTRNEILEYTLGLVVEVPTDDAFLLLENTIEDYLTQETTIDLGNTVLIGPTFGENYVIPNDYNAYTFGTATIEFGYTVTVPLTSTWYIGFVIPDTSNLFLLDTGPGYDGSSVHEHSLTEWTDAWQRERSPGDPLPDLFLPLVNR